VLLGLNAQDYVSAGHIRRFNTSLLLDRTGQVVARYDKTHLVPFGEYVPLYDYFPFLVRFAPYANDQAAMLSAGERFVHMTLPSGDRTYTFGCMICYEDSYAHLARKYMRGPEQPVDFLVNQSNDGWFKCTHEHEEHLAVSRFRAVECRRSLVRAVNMGISAVIDGCGRVVALPGRSWSESKGLLSVVSAAVPLDTRSSLFAMTGDWLSWLCWIAIAFSFARRQDATA
jgi:apolipoprotein N-acyltransferase